MSDVRIPKGWLSIKTQNSFITVSTNKKNVKVKDTLPTGLYPVVDQGATLVGGYHNDEEKVIKLSNPLIVFGDHTRKVKWIDFPFITGADGVKVLDPHPFFDRRLFYFQIMNIDIKDRGYGRHFKLLKDSYSILPALAEQKEIARLLEQYLAQVEQIKAHLEAIPKLIIAFRQSVLVHAVSGKLTEDSRSDNSYKIDGNFEIPQSWKTFTIEEIADVKGGKRLPKGESLVDSNTGYPYIRAGQLKNGTVVSTEEARSSQKYLMPEVQEKLKKYIVKYNDAYLTIVGASIGDAGLIPSSSDGANLTENAAKLTNYKKELNSNFLSYWLRSYWLQQEIQLSIKSAAQGKLALHRIKALPFVYPPIEEQNEIVSRVEELFTFADNIERQTQSATEHVNLLTQSLLAKAFRGELTAEWRKQNPELISGDNSAEALLARIQAQMKGSKAKTKAMS